MPLKDLKPGEYTTQLSVIDQAGRSLGFARAPLIVMAVAAAQALRRTTQAVIVPLILHDGCFQWIGQVTASSAVRLSRRTASTR